MVFSTVHLWFIKFLAESINCSDLGSFADPSQQGTWEVRTHPSRPGWFTEASHAAARKNTPVPNPKGFTEVSQGWSARDTPGNAPTNNFCTPKAVPESHRNLTSHRAQPINKMLKKGAL